MTPQTSKKLNPFAPEYKPIPAGVAPSPHAPPQLSTDRHRPPAFVLPHQIHAYLPSTREQFHPTYHVNNLQNHVSITPPPPAPRNGQSGRGPMSRGRGRGFGRGRRGLGREGERDSSWPSKNKQYSKRVENVHQIVPLKRDEDNTTAMIKNIPYDCPRKELISMLDSFCLLENQKASNEAKSREAQPTPYAYDFLYLPIDFKTKRSRGFAFVNFTSSRAVWSFYDSIHLTSWDFGDRLKWQKRIEIVAAKIQGKEELVMHFSGSVFECATDEYLPVCFTPARDGSGQPVELTVIGNRRSAARW